MFKYKKAQSEIITTVLIILLVLAAIVIVWQVVNSVISSGSCDINSGSACIGIESTVIAVTSADGLGSPSGIAPAAKPPEGAAHTRAASHPAANPSAEEKFSRSRKTAKSCRAHKRKLAPASRNALWPRATNYSA